MSFVADLPEFEDFDQQFVYDRYEDAFNNASTLNFVIQFDQASAASALNLDEKSTKRFLELERPIGDSTRWINIWGPERQKKLIKVLSDRYHFTPRLLGIMCSEHNPPRSVELLNDRSRDKTHMKNDLGSRRSRDTDPEKNILGSHAEIRNPEPSVRHYSVVSEVWHYYSVDWNSKYLCIGYNSLADTSAITDDSSMHSATRHPGGEEQSNNKPKGVRTWTWLVLCDDGTVISIYENPFPNRKEDLTVKEKDLLTVIRRNLFNVFRQLSKVNDDHRRQNPINTLDIRPGLSSNLSSDQSSTINITDSPSLLFYYLFDDWYTTYLLVAKDEHQYAHELEMLRKDMVTKPEVHLIDQLHQYGRELAVLKRMYQSYALIIERILSRQRPVGLTTTPTAMEAPEESPVMGGDMPSGTTILGAPLCSAAAVRFERLLDRINHFALSEIQECLDEKESLVFLNFNLLASKESQAVERLTRVTILLAKVTILFMPVSIMTAYFSTTLTDLADKYTTKTYWICFAVIMCITFLFLLVFGQVSGTVEGKPVYRTLRQIAWSAITLRFNEMTGRRGGRRR